MTKQTPKKKEKKGLGPVAIRHRKVLDKLTKKVGKGKVTMSKVMIEEGYSKSYAESGRIKEKKSWKELTEEYLSDDILARKHGSLLDFKKIEYMMFACDVPEEAIYEIVQEAGGIVKKIVHSVGAVHCYFFKDDGRIQTDATKLAYQVRGKMATEKIQVDIKDKFRQMSQQELADFIKAKKARFAKTD
jgi:hypothetical protein